MEEDIDFGKKYNIVQGDLNITIKCFYTWKKIMDTFQLSSKLLKADSQYSEFWPIVAYSLEGSFFLGLNRIFDTVESSYTIYNFLTYCSANIQLFSRESLFRRKYESINSIKLASEKAKNAFQPDASYFRMLKHLIRPKRDIVEKIYKEIRHVYFAHTILTDKTEVQKLFSQTNKKELEDILYFLYDLMFGIFELFYNGYKMPLGSKKYNYEADINKEADMVLNALLKE